MSVSRLQLEQDLRRAEEAREMEELHRAQEVRREKEQPVPEAAIVLPLLMKRDPREVARTTAAEAVDRWWKNRRRGLLPTDNEIARLVRFIRRGSR
jgi:hypothetical protein